MDFDPMNRGGIVKAIEAAAQAGLKRRNKNISWKILDGVYQQECIKEARTYTRAFLDAISVEDMKEIVLNTPLNISSTRRSGTNGLRNPEDIIHAILTHLKMICEG